MASGDTLVAWQALDNQPPDDDFATFDTLLTTSTDEPDDIVSVLDFDPGAPNEFAVFSAVLPNHYDGGGLTLTILWMANTTTGNVKWDASIKRLVDGTDVLAATYAAIQTVTTGTDGTARSVNTSVITFTDGAQMDGLLANELFFLAVERDAADAADTMNANDAEFIAAHLTET